VTKWRAVLASPIGLVAGAGESRPRWLLRLGRGPSVGPEKPREQPAATGHWRHWLTPCRLPEVRVRPGEEYFDLPVASAGHKPGQWSGCRPYLGGDQGFVEREDGTMPWGAEVSGAAVDLWSADRFTALGPRLVADAPALSSGSSFAIGCMSPRGPRHETFTLK
jgi:hypothetical protein